MTGQFSNAGTAAGAGASPKPLTGRALAYATNVRKISRATLERLGVGSDTVFFPELNRESEASCSPTTTAASVH